MNRTTLEITCRDPIVARDGRPFGADQGYRMRSLDWPLPSVVAGSLRTLLGREAGRGDFTPETAADLLTTAVAGVLPMHDGTLYLPAPADCVVHERMGPLRATPHAIDADCGCDLPNPALQPVMLPASVEDFKPKAAPAWWPMDEYAKWLAGDDIAFDSRFLLSPDVEYRTHVQLVRESGSAEEGKLFTTAALPLTHLRRHGVAEDSGGIDKKFAEIRLASKVYAEGWRHEAVGRLDTLHPLGGERRLVHWKSSSSSSLWDCPSNVRIKLNAETKVRMTLATPAIFAGGWRPGWLLKENLEGSPPRSSVRLRLVGVCIQRWRAVSGWSYQPVGEKKKPGPKAIRRMVPAGGVYFFEVVSGSGDELANRWLEPVSDDEQDRRDGFGLATWGIWSGNK